jgi:hypothetical protein
MRTFGCGLTVLFLASTLACGGAKQEARDSEKSAQGAQDSAQQMTKNMEAMAKGMQAAGDQKPVEPVSFTVLQPLFPDLPGWEKGKLEGEKMTMPFPFSQASCAYTKGDSVLNVKIMDSGFNQALTLPFTMFLASGYERQTGDGYEKSVKVGEFPGWEKWNSESKHGELNAVVGKRFVVTIDGNDLENHTILYTVAEKLDLSKLAGLK